MKIIIAGLATALLASAAFAQTTTPTGQTATQPGQTTTSPGQTMEPTDQSTVTPTPADTMASKPGTEVATLTERNGKWWNGNREATEKEIAAHKKTANHSKPN